ncbi:hypothetical protein BRC91_03855 [Halobacteriales archaeon QS_4_62_28]|nr:MAG: hypothetical protein BRC91_03855 [Halobacteriales archaeon QS_4_62_28]
MSKSHPSSRVDELSDIFVSVTGDDSVTETQKAQQSDREVPDDARVEIEDGLEDAVDGAELGGGDPVS